MLGISSVHGRAMARTQNPEHLTLLLNQALALFREVGAGRADGPDGVGSENSKGQHEAQ